MFNLPCYVAISAVRSTLRDLRFSPLCRRYEPILDFTLHCVTFEKRASRIYSLVTRVVMRTASTTQSQYSNQQVNTAILWEYVTVKEMDQNTE